MSSRSLIAAAWLLATTACTGGGTSFASRFITQGTPSMNVGGPALPGLASAIAAGPQGLGTVLERRGQTLPAGSSAIAASIESTSPRLQRALLALSTSPTSAHYLDVAAAYTAEGIRDKAFDYLTTGLRADRRNAALHDAVARAWRDWGFPDKALNAAHHAVFYAPQSPEAYNTLGTVLWALGQRAEATATFEQATVLDPRAWYAWQNLCEAALTAGQTREATALCKRATAERRAARGASQ